MTELSIIADSKPEGLTFKVEIKTNENTTEDEMAGINSLSDHVKNILQDAQRRSSLKSDWQKQYELTGIEIDEPIQEQGESL